MPISISGDGSIAGLVPGGLPDASVTTADLANNAVTLGKLGTNEASGLCKAWVNFNGTGTVAIRASYNVSSITDNGTGDYTVNFTTAMADANYAAIAVGDGGVASASHSFTYVWAYTTTSVKINQTIPSGVRVDSSVQSVAIFR